jgi:hypothetical protein
MPAPGCPRAGVVAAPARPKSLSPHALIAAGNTGARKDFAANASPARPAAGDTLHVLHIAWVLVPPTTYGLVPDGLCYTAGVMSEAQKARELQYWHDTLQVGRAAGGPHCVHVWRWQRWRRQGPCCRWAARWRPWLWLHARPGGPRRASGSGADITPRHQRRDRRFALLASPARPSPQAGLDKLLQPLGAPYRLEVLLDYTSDPTGSTGRSICRWAHAQLACCALAGPAAAACRALTAGHPAAASNHPLGPLAQPLPCSNSKPNQQATATPRRSRPGPGPSPLQGGRQAGRHRPGHVQPGQEPAGGGDAGQHQLILPAPQPGAAGAAARLRPAGARGAALVAAWRCWCSAASSPGMMVRRPGERVRQVAGRTCAPTVSALPPLAASAAHVLGSLGSSCD